MEGEAVSVHGGTAKLDGRLDVPPRPHGERLHGRRIVHRVHRYRHGRRIARRAVPVVGYERANASEPSVALSTASKDAPTFTWSGALREPVGLTDDKEFTSTTPIR